MAYNGPKKYTCEAIAMSAKPKRRWFQFSLMALLVLITVLCVPLAWLAYERNEVRKREAAIAAMIELDAVFDFDDANPFRPNWMQPLLGLQESREVIGLDFYKTKVTDADLALVGGF